MIDGEPILNRMNRSSRLQANYNGNSYIWNVAIQCSVTFRKLIRMNSEWQRPWMAIDMIRVYVHVFWIQMRQFSIIWSGKKNQASLMLRCIDPTDPSIEWVRNICFSISSCWWCLRIITIHITFRAHNTEKHKTQQKIIRWNVFVSQLRRCCCRSFNVAQKWTSFGSTRNRL